MKDMNENNDIDSMLLKTLFKMLDHDTRNTFVKLNALVGGLDDSPTKNIILDTVQELYSIISASSNFLDGKKDIISLYDVVSKLQLGKDKIPLTSNSRVMLSNDPKVYLFTEVSELFDHAILNLVENALKYSDESTQVEVSIVREKDNIIISVKDQGIGMSDVDKAHIFEQGFRAQTAIGYEGTGLGLWITKNIVERDAGTLEVLDNVGGGSEFKITIPAFFTRNFEASMETITSSYNNDPENINKRMNSIKTLIDMHFPPEEYDYNSLVFANLLDFIRTEKRNRSEPNIKERLASLKEQNPDGKTVIIVDDSTYVHYYLGTFFTKLGFRILDFCINGQEGIESYEANRPDFTTLDITMPIMSGIEASEKILELDSNAKIIFLSGLGLHSGLTRVLKDKFNGKKFGILSKPFTIDELEDSLANF